MHKPACLVRLVLAVLLVCGPASLGRAQEVASRAAGLVDGHGRTETAEVCTACHAAGQFSGQRLSRNGWALVISTMIDEYEMSEPEDSIRDTILTYLSTHFGSAP